MAGVHFCTTWNKTVPGNPVNVVLKNGYHHLDIFGPHQKFLGFYWVIKGNIRLFLFTVLLFGLTSSPFVSTRVLWPFGKYRKFNSVKITCFLDDGICTEYNCEEAKRKLELAQETLTKSGFIPNIEKSTWEPCEVLTWFRDRYKPFIRSIENHQVSHW